MKVEVVKSRMVTSIMDKCARREYENIAKMSKINREYELTQIERNAWKQKFYIQCRLSDDLEKRKIESKKIKDFI